VPSLADGVNHRLTTVVVYIIVADGQQAMAKFSKSKVWDKVQREVPFFPKYPSLKHNVVHTANQKHPTCTKSTQSMLPF